MEGKVRTDRIRTNFWTAEFIDMAKKRKILYDRARKSKSENDIRAHNDLKAQMRKKVAAAKRASYAKFLDELEPQPRSRKQQNVEIISAQCGVHYCKPPSHNHNPR